MPHGPENINPNVPTNMDDIIYEYTQFELNLLSINADTVNYRYTL